MKFSFLSSDEYTAGTFKGKLQPVCELAKVAVSSSVQAGIAACMINKGGAIGIIAVACIATLKICIGMEERI